MNSVEAILLENIDNPASRFVFPTDISSSRWADRLLHLRGGTIAMNKFIAWDEFKQNSIKSKVKNKKSIPSALRKIFVSRLVKENAENVELGKTSIFSSLIRVQWAKQASHFAPWLTRLLPQLGSWFKKTTGLAIDTVLEDRAQKAAQGFEGDEKDMFTLACRYAQFLNEHGLFEPAWETPPFNDDGMECFIFFPESLSDYAEYKELLASSPHVKTVSADGAEKLPCDSFFYTNSRSEITEACLYIRALHENESVEWDAIAVCIPDSENYEPYLLREFTNRNIPFVKRISKPLTDYPTGQFFRAVIDCASREFAFSAFASLVLNNNLPWKDTAQINSLIDFGINNNCISSWVEEKDGKKQILNAWEEAFKKPFGEIEPETIKFFNNLNRRLLALRNADTFSELLKQYFIFRGNFFDMDKFELEEYKESNRILSRCISELIYLKEIEKTFPDISAADAFMFLTEYLDETSYLAQTDSAGVNILPYRTTAAAPFDFHITFGAGQDSLSVVYSALDFLPRKKREKLGIFDEDASLSFINMHKYNSIKRAAFFCCQQSFSGFKIPHSKIDAPSQPRERYANDPMFNAKFSPDHYNEESVLIKNILTSDNTSPLKLHDNQKNGFEQWKNRRKEGGSSKGVSSFGGTSFGGTSFGGASNGKWKTNETLQNFIREIFAGNPQFPGKYSVSSSSLSPYFQCSLKWLFQRVLSLESVQVEASLMAENISGLVYHAALNLFFTQIKEKAEALLEPDLTGRFPSLPKTYRALLEKSVNTIFDFFPALEENKGRQMSSLTARLLRASKKQFLFNLENCLANFLSFFAGYRVTGCEIPYKSPRENYFLNGKIDCTLESPQKDKFIIVDFKMKTTPKRADCIVDEEGGLVDFQLPMYITLAEEKEEKIKVYTALFYSILNLKPEVIIGEVRDVNTDAVIPKKESDRIMRDSEIYKEIFKDFNHKAKQFADEISTGDFSIFETEYSECLNCDFNSLCRTVYVINLEKNITLGNY